VAVVDQDGEVEATDHAILFHLATAAVDHAKNINVAVDHAKNINLVTAVAVALLGARDLVSRSHWAIIANTVLKVAKAKTLTFMSIVLRTLVTAQVHCPQRLASLCRQTASR